MISKKIKDLIQSLAHRFGYHVLSKNCISGDMTLFLEGIKSRGISPKNILDIGAHKADWSLSTSEIFPDAAFYMIEPQEELKPFIDSFLKNHKGAWFLGGAGAENGELTLSVWDDFAGSSFLLPEGQESGKKQRKVPIYSVDGLIAEGKMPIPDICKIDVQGFEIEVLKGAKSILGKTDIFILEASMFKFSPNQPLLHEIIDYMCKNGYVIYDFAGFANRPLDKALGQLDICFVLENSPLRQNHGW
ncbi:FkbM family methyltransferase [Lacihabitans sp. LS3-19]|uniref:FkbM family methyltransferase n=1 Tax=Lacihabitans sp. LS3-19 TaxID=2487335 RepID=UPI0020CF9B47|nr:FkbM family methyltransferase [Lacihabitans sp. LS3-19]MCP9768226.1 FkbM family methyltransferase [Lacihabitans sp. LS3-19]